MSYLDLARRLRGSEPGETKHRLDMAMCLALLDEMHADIRARYLPGALALLDTDSELHARFDATETRIDQLAQVPGGPGEADYRAAIEAHATVWRELIARHQARCDRATSEKSPERSDPMPELPADTVGAIGVSYGDGEPGMWDVVRQARKG